MPENLKDYSRNAWLLDSPSLAKFLEVAYTDDHYGEVWLFNNDLQAFQEEDSFKSLYVNLISDRLKGNIDNVKFVVDEHNFQRLFKDSTIRENIQRIANLNGGKGRLSTFYFARLEDFEFDESQKNLLDETWVFYTHGGHLSSKGGVVMLRQKGFPFDLRSRFSDKVTMSWLLSDHKTLQSRLKEKFESIFNDTNKFSWLSVNKSDRQDFSFDLIEGESPVSKNQKWSRKNNYDTPPLSFGENVDVAVITALRQEANAFESVIKEEGYAIRKTPLDSRTYTIIRQRNGKEITVLISHLHEQGTVAAALHTQDVISQYNPDFLIMTGVCGGSKNKVNLGDVIVADEIYYYDLEKVFSVETVETMHRGYQTGPNLKNRAKKIAEEGPIEIHYDGTDFECNVIDEMIVASGSKLVLDPDFFKRLGGKPKLCTTEMEGAGFAMACEIRGIKEFMLVKGVMDHCDKNTREKSQHDKRKWKNIAAKSAAKFVSELIKDI